MSDIVCPACKGNKTAGGRGTEPCPCCAAKGTITTEKAALLDKISKDLAARARRELLILSGLPGSGKTTLARFLLSVDNTGEGVIASADDHFTCSDGAYRYIATQVGRAHILCQRKVERAMIDGRAPVIVDNTNTTFSEIKVYVELAKKHHYRTKVVRLVGVEPAECFERQRHDVPVEMFARLVQRFQQRNVDPEWDVEDNVQWWPVRSVIEEIGDLA